MASQEDAGQANVSKQHAMTLLARPDMCAFLASLDMCTVHTHWLLQEATGASSLPDDPCTSRLLESTASSWFGMSGYHGYQPPAGLFVTSQ
jgi:hypothetical protein